MLIFVSLSFEPASVKELVVTVSMTVKNEYLIKWLQHIFKCGFKYFLKKLKVIICIYCLIVCIKAIHGFNTVWW